MPEKVFLIISFAYYSGLWLLALIVLTLSSIYILTNLLCLLYEAPFVPSSRSVVKKMIELAEIKPGQLIFDLGCGDGRLVFAAAEKGAQATGIEINIFVYPLAFLIKRIFHKTGNIRFENLLDTNLSQADVVFCFLVHKGMRKLSSKFKNELKKGCKVISHGTELPGWTAEKMISVNGLLKNEVIYVYSA